jgi:hypothetical protein
MGITYSAISSSKFSARLSPGGFIFDVAGSSVFPDNINFILGLMNSKLADYTLNLVNPTINVQIGDIGRIPVPTGDSSLVERATAEAIDCAKSLSAASETTYDFVQPYPNVRYNLQLLNNLNELENKIDAEVSKLYSLSAEDLAAINAELEDRTAQAQENGESDSSGEEEEAATGDLNDQSLALNWISYAIGMAFGRFEPGKKDGLGCGSFPAATNSKLNKLASPSGILVEDRGHELDITEKTWETLAAMLGEERAREMVNNGLSQGDPLEAIGNWLNRFTGQSADSFWRYHLQLYRKRPVYWPLQSPGRKFTAWIFHERLTGDTLFTIRRDIVETKLRLTRRQIEEVKGQGKSGRTARQVEDLKDLEMELKAFSDQLTEIIERGYTPHIDDGVLLNAAPLHGLLTSWPDTKKAWQEMERGEYDWAQQAMDHWPDRVKRKCQTDKSLAIAHGREDLYQEPADDKSGKRKRK